MTPTSKRRPCVTNVITALLTRRRTHAVEATPSLRQGTGGAAETTSCSDVQNFQSLQLHSHCWTEGSSSLFLIAVWKQPRLLDLICAHDFNLQHTHAQTHSHPHTRTPPTHTHTHIHTDTQTHTHTHTHTHKHTQRVVAVAAISTFRFHIKRCVQHKARTSKTPQARTACGGRIKRTHPFPKRGGG